jgi:hypothetical protein
MPSVAKSSTKRPSSSNRSNVPRSAFMRTWTLFARVNTARICADTRKNAL